MKAFLDISRGIGGDVLHVQGPAGNTSLKIGSRMVIKASGVHLREMSEQTGYVECMLPPIQKFLADPSCENLQDPETALNRIIEESTRMTSQRSVASIETGMHAMIPSNFVLHTHSVYINVAACMEGGEALLREALGIPFVYIPYANPGFFLARAIGMAVARQGGRFPPILILENHGLVIHHDDPHKALDLLLTLTRRMEDFLGRRRAFIPFVIRELHIDPVNHLFPDSAVFTDIDPTDLSQRKKTSYYEVASAALYIQETIDRLGGRARYLSDANVQYIQNMEKEKRRRQNMNGIPAFAKNDL